MRRAHLASWKGVFGLLQDRAAGNVHVKEVDLAVDCSPLAGSVHDDVAVVSARRSRSKRSPHCTRSRAAVVAQDSDAAAAAALRHVRCSSVLAGSPLQQSCTSGAARSHFARLRRRLVEAAEAEPHRVLPA